MKRCVFFLCVTSALIFVSCKSTPQNEQPVEPQQVPAPAETPAPAVVEKPTEATIAVTEPETPKPKDFSADNADLFEKTKHARDMAIAANAPSILEEAWNQTEKLYSTLEADCNGDLGKTDLSSRIKDVTARYGALEQAAFGYKAKQRVDGLDFASMDQKDYDAGEAAYADVISLYDNGASGSELLQKTTEGYTAYAKVLTSAFRQLADKERQKALAQKKNADSVMAGVSSRDSYLQAVKLFQYADSQYVTKDLEGAYGSYQKAVSAFSDLYTTVSEKRAAAEKAIAAAKANVSASGDYASEADGVAPLGDEEVNGIEAPDAVLVKQEDFADPDSAVVPVADTPSADTATEGDAKK